jgi:tRNA uridine 5-carboxymethylaminomethyl modification enzyme
LLETTQLGRARLELHGERRAAMGRVHAAIDEGVLRGDPLDRWIQRAGFGLADLREALPGVSASEDAWFSAWADRRYRAYIERQARDVRRTEAMEHRRLPDRLDIDAIDGLRSEARAALERFRPETFGQAGRLEGVTPADVMLVSVHLEKRRGARARDRAALRAGDRLDGNPSTSGTLSA